MPQGYSGQETLKRVWLAVGSSLNPTALSAFHVSIDLNAEIGGRLGSSGAGTREEVVPLA